MSPLPKTSFKHALFDLAVIASVVAAVYLGGRGVGKAPSIPVRPEPAIGSDGTADGDSNATQSEPSALIENRRRQRKQQRLRQDLTKARTRLRDALVAEASTSAKFNVPLTYGEALIEGLSRADTGLLKIELSERVLELERLGLPLCPGVVALNAGLRAQSGRVSGQVALSTRYLHDHAARLVEFKGKLAACRELDARLTGRGNEVYGRYQKMIGEHERLNDIFEGLELRATRVMSGWSLPSCSLTEEQANRLLSKAEFP